jgi:hypothetical protein
LTPALAARSPVAGLGRLYRVPTLDRPAASLEAPPAEVKTHSRREPALDIARGVLMVFIVTNHALDILAPTAAPHLLVQALTLCLSGTVGFTTVSGTLVGYFSLVKLNRFDAVEARYRRQAWRLLLVAHPLIALALAGPGSGDTPWWQRGLTSLYITDVLALLFALLVPLVPRLRPARRLWLGVGLVLVSRALWLVPVEGRPGLFVRDLLCDIHPERHLLYSTYSLLSLAGFFLVGTFVGHLYGEAEAAGRLVALAARLRRAASRNGVPELVREALYPDYYFSLYPAYLAATLALIALLLEGHGPGRVRRFFEVFGKTSLFTFVVQYFLVQALPGSLGWTAALSAAQATTFIAVSLGALWLAAEEWNRLVKKA